MDRRMLAIGVAAIVLSATACGDEQNSSPQAASGEGAPPAAAAASAAARRCATRVTYLFWPRGHPAIPAINFPYLAMPHVEVYGGDDDSYPTSAALAWAFTSPPGPSFPQRSTKPQCLSDSPADELAPIRHATTTAKAIRLVCRLPDGAQIVNEERGPHRYRTAVVDSGSETVVDGLVDNERSSLSYSPSVCTQQKPLTP